MRSSPQRPRVEAPAGPSLGVHPGFTGGDPRPARVPGGRNAPSANGEGGPGGRGSRAPRRGSGSAEAGGGPVLLRTLCPRRPRRPASPSAKRRASPLPLAPSSGLKTFFSHHCYEGTVSFLPAQHTVGSPRDRKPCRGRVSASPRVCFCSYDDVEARPSRAVSGAVLAV